MLSQALVKSEEFSGELLDLVSSWQGRFNIRKAQKRDNKSIKELIQRILIQQGGVGVDSLYYDDELVDIHDHYSKEGRIFLVLTYSRQVVGAIGLAPYEGGCFGDTPSCEIKKLYLRKDFRKMGRGKVLLDKAMKQAKKFGYKYVITKTERRNESFMEFLLRENFDLKECSFSTEDEPRLSFYREL